MPFVEQMSQHSKVDYYFEGKLQTDDEGYRGRRFNGNMPVYVSVW